MLAGGTVYEGRDAQLINAELIAAAVRSKQKGRRGDGRMSDARLQKLERKFWIIACLR